ncbi:MAG: hypothetical protein K0R57_1138 [Paenibacillaceae bacterium]|nr:hypothetical protein [Paenibacillaceae bacterium]
MDDKREFYPLIVLGATFAGIGAAYANKADTLILERTALAGYEFANAYRIGEGWNDVILSETGKQLKLEMLQRNILSEQGEVHIPALAPLVYNRLKKDQFNILLMAELVGITRAESQYCVEVHTASGFKKFFTNTIIDTRTDALPGDFIKIKSINALLYSEEEASICSPASQGAVELMKGKQRGEVIVRLPVEADDDWSSAREKLHTFWRNRPGEWKAWRIISVGASFDIRADQGPVRVMDNWSLLPSAAYRNPLEALEAGLLHAEGKVRMQ